jgi:hypothetical protein
MATRKTKASTTRKAPARMSRAAAGESKSKKPALKLNSRQLLIGASVLAVIVLLLLYSTFFGGGGADPIAAHISSDAVFYVHLNLKEVHSQGMQDILAAFKAASGTTEEQAKSDFTDQLKSDWGIDFEKDVQPWLGDQGGAAAIKLQMNQLTGTGDFGDSRVLAIVQTRNNSQTDAFITKLTQSAEDKGSTVTSSDAAGGKIYSVDGSAATFAIARLGNLVYFSNNVDTIKSSAELDPMDSIASLDGYKKAIAELPGNRFATLILNSAGYMKFMEDMLSTMPGNAANQIQQALPYDFTLAASISVVAEGFQIDTVAAVAEDQLTDQVLQSLKASHKPDYSTLAFFPENTILYFVSATNQSPLDQYEQLYPQMMTDFDESMDLLKTQTGIDFKELLNAMDKEVSFGLFPQQGGLSALTGLGMGFQMVFSTTQDQAFADFFGTLNGLLEAQLGTASTQKAIGAMNVYVVADPFAGQEIASFGSGGGFAYIGTNTTAIENGLIGNGKSLADSETYQEAWKHFPGNAYPTFYFDVPKFIELLNGMDASMQDTLAGFTPITLVASASEPYSAGISHGVMIIFIDRTPPAK